MARSAFVIALALLAAVVARAEDAHRRSLRIEGWAKAHTAAMRAGGERDPVRLVAAIRRAAEPTLGKLSEGDVGAMLVAAADQMFEDGDAPAGLAAGEASLALVGDGDPARRYDALTRTGSGAYFLSDFDRAARDLGMAADEAAKIKPFDAAAVANARANYAVILDQAGRYAEAEETLKQAIALRESSRGDRRQVGVAQGALAAVYKRQGRPDLAERTYRAALDTMEQAGAAGSHGYMILLHNYAVFVSDMGRDEEAVAIYRRTLELTPPDKRRAANMIPEWSTLASALEALGRLDEAEAAIDQAIAIAVTLPKPTMDVSAAYANRAAIHAARGRWEEAEADRRRALAIDRDIFGDRPNGEVATDLTSLATVLRQRGKITEADRLSAEAVAEAERLPRLSPRRPIVIDERAAVLAALGRRADALAAARQATDLLVERRQASEGRELGPEPIDERPILQRRVALVWQASSSDGIGK